VSKYLPIRRSADPPILGGAGMVSYLIGPSRMLAGGVTFLFFVRLCEATISVVHSYGRADEKLLVQPIRTILSVTPAFSIMNSHPFEPLFEPLI
jgi:hypothetical protein